jgi:Bifunctional DNA primase/polymerase, N-terminal
MTSRLEGILCALAEHDLWAVPQLITDEGEKRPLVRWKPYQDRAPTRDEIAGWCLRFPHAGAAIPTGPGTNLLVVVADSPDAIEWLGVRGMPETPIVRTRHGLHYYLRYPVDLQIRYSAGALTPGVDIRGAGGMATAAGTLHPCGSGFIYHYDEGHALGQIAITNIPDWLFNWLLQQDRRRQFVQPVTPRQFDGKVRAWARAAIDGELARLADTSPGTRNHTLASVAFKLGALCGGGEADAGELRAALFAAAEQWPDERLKSADTIARAFGEGMAHPRSAPRSQFKRRNPSAHTPGLAGEYEEGVSPNG